MDTNVWQALLAAVGGNEEAAKALVAKAADTNREIEQSDLMRRSANTQQVQPTTGTQFQEMNTSNTQAVYIDQSVFNQLKLDVFADDMYTSLVARMTKVETEHHQRLNDLETENAKLRTRVIELERDDEKKWQDAVNAHPSNRSAIYLTTAPVTSTAQQRQVNVTAHSDDVRFAAQQSLAHTQNEAQRMLKSLAGGK